MSIPFEVKRSFQVKKEEAYAGLIDLDSAHRWMQGLVRIEQWMQDRLEKAASGRKRERCSVKKPLNILR
jgi:hypothetical protein